MNAWTRRVGVRLAHLDRRRTPHRILLRVLPRLMGRRFDAGAAADLEATFELSIRDPHGLEPARYELAIGGGRCTVRPGPASRPGARAVLGSDDLILLATGAASWPELLSSGRFELSGDPFLALRLATMFRMPVALEPVA